MQFSVSSFPARHFSKGVATVRYSVQPSGGKRLACGLDEDSGSFDLKPVEDGFLLENKNNFAVLPAIGNYANDSEKTVAVARNDDREAFLLKPSTTGVCDARFPPRSEDSDWN